MPDELKMLLSIIVNRGKWFGSPAKFFVICFCSLFCGLTLHKTTLELGFRNSCIVYERKTKDVQGRRPSNINLGLFVCSFDVCWAS